MNVGQFEELCRSCDSLIQLPDASVERIAIQWLHVIREHPIFLWQYQFLFMPGDRLFPVAVRRFSATFHARLWGVRQFFRTFSSQAEYRKQAESLPSGIDYLFVSHFVNPSQASGSSPDFYFGDLPSSLAARGATVVVALINQTRRESRVSIEPICTGRVVRILLPLSLDRAGERAVLARLRTESKRLEAYAGFAAGLAAKVARWASLHALGGASRTAMRIGMQVSGLAKQIAAKNLVYTFEGHAWEWVTCALTRDTVPGIECIAYQHAALFERQHAIRRNLAPRYNPDVILTSNGFAKAEFESIYSSGQKKAVVELGSPRGLPEGRPGRARSSSHPEGICLVLPEGIESECDILFEFSRQCAALYPGIRFVWRLHPLMSIRRLRLRNPALWSLPSNVVVSGRSLEEDVGVSKWALYRGTTAVASAVVAGARPIYFHRDGEIPFDPLFRMGGFRAVVKEPSDLAGIFSDETDRSEAAAAARGLCRVLFPPMKATEVAEWLTMRAAISVAPDNSALA